MPSLQEAPHTIDSRTTERRSATAEGSVTSLACEHQDLWEHAALLYHGYEWQAAAEAFSSLAHDIGSGRKQTFCLINAAMIHARLADYGDAIAILDKTIAPKQEMVLIMFLLGFCAYELGYYSRAEAQMEVCLRIMDGSNVHYAELGMDFVLTSATVMHNLECSRRHIKPDISMVDVIVYMMCMPAECIFEAPRRTATLTSSGTTGRSSGADLTISSMSTPTEPSPRLEGSTTDHPRSMIAKPRSVETLAASAEATTSPTRSTPRSGRSFSSVIDGQTSSWHRRPRTPYVARDARVQTDSLRELATFIRAGPEAASQMQMLPRDAQAIHQSNKGLVEFIQHEGHESRVVAGGSLDLGRQVARLDSDLRPARSTKSLKVPSTNTFDGATHSLRSVPKRRTSPDSRRDVLRLDEPGLASAPTALVSSSSARAPDLALEILQPTVYCPKPRLGRAQDQAHMRVQPQSLLHSVQSVSAGKDDRHPMPSTQQLHLVLGPSQPSVLPASTIIPGGAFCASPGHYSSAHSESTEFDEPWNAYAGVRTAADSMSSLFTPSMRSVKRAELARNETLRVLEGGMPRQSKSGLRGRLAEQLLAPSPLVINSDADEGQISSPSTIASGRFFELAQRR